MHSKAKVSYVLFIKIISVMHDNHWYYNSRIRSIEMRIKLHTTQAKELVTFFFHGLEGKHPIRYKQCERCRDAVYLAVKLFEALVRTEL
jgi:hypothetical protein